MLNIILLVTSLIIYLSFGISNFIFIGFSMLSSFFAAKFLKSKNSKAILGFTIFINAIILIGVKFLPFTEASIIAPLGISYYTLQVISYLVDVYKGKIETETNLFYYALYIFYIPHIFIGPIIRYEEMKSQILKKKRIKFENLVNGGIRILWGLSKKLIIAGRISILISSITVNTDTYGGAFALFAMILYGIQLYADFSGGIDIVIRSF